MYEYHIMYNIGIALADMILTLSWQRGGNIKDYDINSLLIMVHVINDNQTFIWILAF